MSCSSHFWTRTGSINDNCMLHLESWYEPIFLTARVGHRTSKCLPIKSSWAMILGNFKAAESVTNDSVAQSHLLSLFLMDIFYGGLL